LELIVTIVFFSMVLISAILGIRKHGSANAYFSNSFKKTASWITFLLFCASIIGTVSAIFISYIYIKTDDEGKALIAKALHQMANPHQTISETLRKNQKQ
jgi:amino acid transporter